MNKKRVMMICLALGGIIGGYAPALWGGSGFSMTSILLSGVGGVIGIWVGFKITHY